jgi:AcrR family transcriptional regulator
MAATLRNAIKPRKTPIQERSTITVEAITEATIQVLLSHGTDRLTTTRVAERAGVSIGTLYQYYPNKQSLMCALLERKHDSVSSAIEAACEASRGKPIADMMRCVVEKFVDAKMLRTDISTALYKISEDVGGPEIVRRANARSLKALGAMFATAPDNASKPDPFAVQMMYSAMYGATRVVLEAGTSPAMVRKLREHLVLLCEGYVNALRNRQ